MTNLSLTDEQVQLKQLINKFASEEIRPVADEYDKKTKAEDCVPWSLIEKALAMKLGALMIPEEYGGGGYKNIDLAVVAEELAWGDAGFASTILGNVHGSKPIINFGTEEQKKKWLTVIANDTTNRFLLAGAFTEPNAGSDVLSPD